MTASNLFYETAIGIHANKVISWFGKINNLLNCYYFLSQLLLMLFTIC